MDDAQWKEGCKKEGGIDHRLLWGIRSTLLLRGDHHAWLSSWGDEWTLLCKPAVEWSFRDLVRSFPGPPIVGVWRTHAHQKYITPYLQHLFIDGYHSPSEEQLRRLIFQQCLYASVGEHACRVKSKRKMSLQKNRTEKENCLSKPTA